MTIYTQDASHSYRINGDRRVGHNLVAVKPTVYLNSDIETTIGDGSQSNPYKLAI